MTEPTSFVWYELMTTDPEAAEAFYRAVVGWEAQAWGGPDAGYTILSAGGKPAAGLMALPEEVRQAGGRPAWIGYIHAEDVDRATESVRAAGGAVHRVPADIPGIGRFSVVADPHGAAFMLFKPEGGEGEPVPPMTPGHVAWHELYAGDGASAFDFYAGQFGWTKAEAMDLGSMCTYQLFAAGGAPTGGIMTKPPAVPRPLWLFYVMVPGIDAAAERVTAHGGQVVNGPVQVPGGGWILQGLDPQGALFALTAGSR